MNRSLKHKAKREDIRKSPQRPTGEGYWVPGERAVLELLQGDPHRAQKLWVEEGRTFAQLVALAQSHQVPVQVASREELEGRVGVGLARGVVLQALPPRQWDIEEWLAERCGEEHEPALAVALDEVGDPQNLGAILRSAEFFGAKGVIWGRDRSAPLSALAVRASAGASERIATCVTTNLIRGLEICKKAGFWLVGTTVDAPVTLPTFLANKPPHRVIVVMGSEERGLRRLTQERCDFLVTIARHGSVGSLNVGAAAAVCLSAFAQQIYGDVEV